MIPITRKNIRQLITPQVLVLFKKNGRSFRWLKYIIQTHGLTEYARNNRHLNMVTNYISNKLQELDNNITLSLEIWEDRLEPLN